MILAENSGQQHYILSATKDSNSNLYTWSEEENMFVEVSDILFSFKNDLLSSSRVKSALFYN